MDDISQAVSEHMAGSNSFTKQYMQQMKTKLGISSDYALAKHLRVSKTTVSNYSNGKAAFSESVCYRVAEIIGQHPAIVLASIEVDRHSGAEQKQIDTWSWIRSAALEMDKRLQKGVSHVAMLICLAIVSIAGYAPNAEAAALSFDKSASQSVYYVKSLMRFFSALRRAARATVARFVQGINHVQSADTDAPLPHAA